MKIYGTLTSERASKGQGGDSLTIHISGEDRRNIWQIDIGSDGSMAINDISGGTFNRAYSLRPTKRGEKQTVKPCGWCGQKPCRNGGMDKCVITNPFKKKGEKQKGEVCLTCDSTGWISSTEKCLNCNPKGVHTTTKGEKQKGETIKPIHPGTAQYKRLRAADEGNW